MPRACFSRCSSKAQDKPNPLIIFHDDVGWGNDSAYGNGVMAYNTPNIDRIANEGIMFTEHYASPSCTAGRSALIIGQYPIQIGMTTVGRSGAELGLKKETPTLAEVLEKQDYTTRHFGKNHLGDRNSHLPSVQRLGSLISFSLSEKSFSSLILTHRYL